MNALQQSTRPVDGHSSFTQWVCRIGVALPDKQLKLKMWLKAEGRATRSTSRLCTDAIVCANSHEWDVHNRALHAARCSAEDKCRSPQTFHFGL
jgi:hypothetical protein